MNSIVPIYLNEMLNNRHPNEAFNASLKLLESINCYVPKKLEEIKPGFVAFAKRNKNIDAVSLTDIIKL
jgi:hypothetical protein